MKSHFPKGSKRAVLFCVIAAGLLSVCLSCSCRSWAAELEDNERLDFGSFTLASVEQEGGLSSVVVYHNGAVLHADSDLRVRCDTDPIMSDFPATGCSTLKVNLFTGGANCCFGYYILSTCPSGDHAAYISPYDGSLGKPFRNKAFEASDAYFSYYEPDDQQSEPKISLSRAESPSPRRLIVFDADGQWRADRIGEFKEYYLALSNEKWDREMDGTLAGAILNAYYRLMAGQTQAEVSAVFRGHIPGEYANRADQIFEDVLAAVRGFDPARNFVLSQSPEKATTHGE